METPVLGLRSCTTTTGNEGGGAPTSCSGSSYPSLSMWRDCSEITSSQLWIEEQLTDPKWQLSLDWFARHAHLANISVPFYSDTTKSGYLALKSSRMAPLGEIVRNITVSCGKQNIGTQVVVKRHPLLMNEVVPIKMVTELLILIVSGVVDHFDCFRFRRLYPYSLLDRCIQPPIQNDGNNHPCTDFHYEPIGNKAAQLEHALLNLSLRSQHTWVSTFNIWRPLHLMWV